jgi:hypothetical protein
VVFERPLTSDLLASHLDLTGSDIVQSLLRVSKGRKIAGSPFRSVTLAIPSPDPEVSSGELAALNEYRAVRVIGW